MAESLFYFSPWATPWDSNEEVCKDALKGQINQSKIFFIFRNGFYLNGFMI